MKNIAGFNRRVMLAGAGVCIALPFLETLSGRRGAARADTPASLPPRVITFHFPHGVVRSHWEPSSTGTGYQMSPGLGPLESLRDDITVITGLANPTGFEAAGGGQHAQGMATFANGYVCTSKGAGGPTLEQVAAARFGSGTRFRSLVVNNEPFLNETDEFTTAHVNNISWSAKEVFVPADRTPQALFERIFAAPIKPGDPPGSPSGIDVARARQESILDYVAERATALSTQVSGDDKARLDQHLTSIRELERQLMASGSGGGTGSGQGASMLGCEANPPAANLPDDERARVNLSLLALALRCGLTRYASFAMSNGFYLKGIPGFSNVTEYHQFVHDRSGDEVAPLIPYFVEMFAHFLRELKSDEGGFAVLDNSIVFFSSEMGVGTHHRDPMPVVIGGRAGGRLTPGRHLAVSGNMGNLLLALARLAGLDEPGLTFGPYGKSPLSELS